MNTMKIYKCYQVYGYKEAFFLQPLKTHPYNWDEITVQLPEGAEPVKTEFGSPAVKLANGHLCTHLFTDWQKDCVVPYLIDTEPTDPKKVHRILLDVVQEGDTDEMD